MPYKVMFEDETEPPYQNDYFGDDDEVGVYRCRNCGSTLFSSD